MARADKPKQATGRTREPQEQDSSPLADSADDSYPADDIDALEAGGKGRTWRWHGEQGGARSKGAAGNKVSATDHRPTRRRARAAPRPAFPKGRVSH